LLLVLMLLLLMLRRHGERVERDLLLLSHRLVVVLTLRGLWRVADGGAMAPKLWQGGRALEALEVKGGLYLLLLWEATCLRFLS
jgi:hypothetical protein